MSKRAFNFLYGIGAAVVIAGVTLKFANVSWSIWAIIAGMAVEAFIFFISAFDRPDPDYDWTLVYPELADGQGANRTSRAGRQEQKEMQIAEQSLSEKLDKMLADAQIDVSVFQGLKDGVAKLNKSVDAISDNMEVSNATVRYNEQLGRAANQLESLNALYDVQLQQSKALTDNLSDNMNNQAKLSTEFSDLQKNLHGLNRVYGGMLSAMNVSNS